LVQVGTDLALYLFDANGADPPRELLVGQPLYWSWAPDGNTIAVHVGGDAASGADAWVGLFHLSAGDAPQERFADPPGVFRAPAWSPSSAKLAYATLGGGTSFLSVRDTTGQVTRLTSSTRDIAFNWSPPNSFGHSAGRPRASNGSVIACEGAGLRAPRPGRRSTRA
jgi:Tol biopolymer transport system component